MPYDLKIFLILNLIKKNLKVSKLHNLKSIKKYLVTEYYVGAS